MGISPARIGHLLLTAIDHLGSELERAIGQLRHQTEERRRRQWRARQRELEQLARLLRENMWGETPFPGPTDAELASRWEPIRLTGRDLVRVANRIGSGLRRNGGRRSCPSPDARLEAALLAELRAFHTREARTQREKREALEARVPITALRQCLPASPEDEVVVTLRARIELCERLADTAIDHALPGFWTVRELRELPAEVEALVVDALPARRH